MDKNHRPLTLREKEIRALQVLHAAARDKAQNGECAVILEGIRKGEEEEKAKAEQRVAEETARAAAKRERRRALRKAAVAA